MPPVEATAARTPLLKPLTKKPQPQPQGRLDTNHAGIADLPTVRLVRADTLKLTQKSKPMCNRYAPVFAAVLLALSTGQRVRTAALPSEDAAVTPLSSGLKPCAEIDFTPAAMAAGTYTLLG